MASKPIERRTVSLGFTDEPAPEGQHICHLYSDDSERLRVMAKFMESGISENEKLIYVIDTMTPEEMLDCLEELGVDTREQASRFTTYCPQGIFSTQAMLALLRDFYDGAMADGKYAGGRLMGEMSWSLVEGRVDETSLMEYEARVTTLLASRPLTACCQYDTRRFDGSTIMDVLAVHPLMIVRGQLVKNPYYIEPDEFLRKHLAVKAK